MRNNYRTITSRSANMFRATPQRMESEDGLRWATGRTVKGEGDRPHTYVPVEVWTLKMRDENGKAVTVETYKSKEAAMNWVGVWP